MTPPPLFLQGTHSFIPTITENVKSSGPGTENTFKNPTFVLLIPSEGKGVRAEKSGPGVIQQTDTGQDRVTANK